MSRKSSARHPESNVNPRHIEGEETPARSRGVSLSFHRWRMIPRAVSRATTVAALLLLPQISQAELATIETQDLRLVYNRSTLSFLAPYASRCFENSMRFHQRLFHYTPTEKVNVILDDVSDFGNAGVSVNPRNSMLVHIAPVNFVYETGPSNERINFTMNHEVVHVVALDQAAGADKVFRELFRGKVRETNEHPESILYSFLCLPRRAAPRWYHEGIAVFLETWMAGGIGRAQGPYDEMVFRSMVRDGSRFYDPLGLESEGTKVDFQIGANSYLYGTRFLSYLAFREASATSPLNFAGSTVYPWRRHGRSGSGGSTGSSKRTWIRSGSTPLRLTAICRSGPWAPSRGRSSIPIRGRSTPPSITLGPWRSSRPSRRTGVRSDAYAR